MNYFIDTNGRYRKKQTKQDKQEVIKSSSIRGSQLLNYAFIVSRGLSHVSGNH